MIEEKGEDQKLEEGQEKDTIKAIRDEEVAVVVEASQSLSQISASNEDEGDQAESLTSCRPQPGHPPSRLLMSTPTPPGRRGRCSNSSSLPSRAPSCST